MDSDTEVILKTSHKISETHDSGEEEDTIRMETSSEPGIITEDSHPLMDGDIGPLSITGKQEGMWYVI